MNATTNAGSTTRYQILRYLLACLLVATAIAKLLSPQHVLGTGGLLSHPWLFTAAIAGELVIACLILTSTPRRSWQLACLTFASLAMVSAYALATNLDCNCFGSRTPKGLPLLVNVACLAALSVCRPAFHCVDPPAEPPTSDKFIAKPKRLKPQLLATTAVAIIGVVAGWAAIAGTAPTADKMPTWFGENLIGHRFPLYQFPAFAELVDKDDKLVVMMFRPDCEHCRELAKKWATEPPDWLDDRRVISVVMTSNRWILIPDKITATIPNVSPSTEITWEATEEPFVASPAIFKLGKQITERIVNAST